VTPNLTPKSLHGAESCGQASNGVCVWMDEQVAPATGARSLLARASSGAQRCDWDSPCARRQLENTCLKIAGSGLPEAFRGFLGTFSTASASDVVSFCLPLCHTACAYGTPIVG
jgi:hypothetical protein